MFHRILSTDASTVLISTRSMKQRIELDVHAKSPFLEAAQMAVEDVEGVDAPDGGDANVGNAQGGKEGYRQIAELWEKLLSVKNVGPDDNYFALGGDSLSAVRFLNQVEKSFGKRIPFASMVEFPTPKKLADYLQLDAGVEKSAGSNSNVAAQAAGSAKPNSQSMPSGARSTLMELANSGGDLTPLFCMHAADGYALIFRELCQSLNPNRPVFGLQSPALFGEPIESIEALAARYVADILQKHPDGPYRLAGYCMGGTIAIEVAQQLRAAGKEVECVIGIETYNWHTSLASSDSRWVQFVYYLQKIDFHFRNFWMLNLGLKWKFIKGKLQAVWRRRKVWFSSRSKGAESTSAQISPGEIWCRHDEAAEEYLPSPFEGALTLIRAKKDYMRYSDKPFPLSGEGRVELQRMRVYPAGMMAAPFAKELAELIEVVLNDQNRP